MRKVIGQIHSTRTLAVLLAATIALLALPGTALAVNPHRPIISNINPNFGPISGGTTVTFTGTNLRTPITVTFGGNLATGCDFTGITGTAGTFTCVTPSSTVFGLVTVTVKNKANGNSGSLVIPNAFTYTCDSCTVSPVSALFEGVAPGGTTEPNGILEPEEGAVAFSPTWFNASDAGFTGNAFTGDLSNPVLAGGTLTTPTSHAQYPNLGINVEGQCTTCYSLNATFGGPRPTGHIDATVDETPSIAGGPSPDTADKHTWTIHIGKTFTDVVSSDIFYTHIEELVHNNVTVGTGDGSTYSPALVIPRNQMAAFIARAMAGGDGNVPSSETISSANNPIVNGSYDCTNGGNSLFADVNPDPAIDGFCKHIHYIAGQNITVGCDTNVPPNYCESTTVTRRTMAVFIAKALVAPDGDALVPIANDNGLCPGTSCRQYDCSAGPAPFTDVPITDGACRHIGYVWTLGIASGFGDGTFRPDDPTHRNEMAAFIVNAFNLSVNKP
jgi:hypothetical protein